MCIRDSQKIRFGTGNDLQIYHNGSHSYITDVGTGNLNIEGNGASIRINNGSSENMAVFYNNAQVELFYDNSKKAETVTGGFTITGTCTATAYAGDGSGLTGVSSQVADGCVTENSLTISNNYTMTTNKSGISAGDITIASAVTVTIPSGSRYFIV